jgi:hypothetical protein
MPCNCGNRKQAIANSNDTRQSQAPPQQILVNQPQVVRSRPHSNVQKSDGPTIRLKNGRI